MVHGF
jgi:poly(3-hydroxyalkanoate) synthetase